MNFGRQDQDDEIIRLLGKLSDSGPAYPSSMFSKRRAAVMAAFAALNLGAATAGLSLLANLVKVVKAMGVVEKVILGVEVAAVTGMTAYGAATAYKYRYEIQRALEQTFESTTATPWPSLVVPGAGGAATEFTEIGTATPTPTGSPTPTGTWYPTTEPSGPGETQPPETQVAQPSSTPPPQAVATTPGLHLGQTKTPRPSNTPKPSGGGGSGGAQP